MDLPKNEKTFEVQIVGDTTGKKYEGAFTVKCVLTMSEKHILELEKNRLIADRQNPTPNLAAIAGLVSVLSVKVIDAPDWWKQSRNGMSLLDENVVVELYEKTQEQERAWKDELSKKLAPQEGN